MYLTSALLGKTILSIQVNREFSIQINREKDNIIFICSNGEVFKMYHDQDCCETVSIDDIDGDLEDLIGNPITLAEESTSNDKGLYSKNQSFEDSITWTFYRLATVKGYVNIRWYGESNGYYSESVDFKQLH